MFIMEDTTMTEPQAPANVPPAPKKPNKRSSRRSAARGSTRLRIYRNALGLGPNIASSLLDLSETGLRVVLKEAAKVGQEVEVNLESGATGRIVKMPGTVVWVVSSSDGTFVVGVHLQKPLGYSDLQSLTKL